MTETPSAVAPVLETDRIASLDVLRGIAVFGNLLMRTVRHHCIPRDKRSAPADRHENSKNATAE